VVFVLERIGVYLTGEIKNLYEYAESLRLEAVKSPLAEDIPSELPAWHAQFSTLYDLVRGARNDALHEGAFARHLTSHAVELSVVLEDALMAEVSCARDFMVGNPVCAFPWEPVSSIRRSMLVNSFSFLPIASDTSDGVHWKLISDYSIAAYLRGAGGSSERKRRLAQKLTEVQDIRLIDAPVCKPEDSVQAVLERSQGQPVLVLGPDSELLGIVTPFDVL
jgi:CBS domain-containing protein